MLNDMHSLLALSNLEIFRSGEFSDIEIRCGDRAFPVHRNIICPKSKFFAAALSGQFQEAENRIIMLDDEDPETMHRLLMFLYTTDYDDGSGSDKKDATFANIAVYAAADQYDVDALKELAEGKFAVAWPRHDFANVLREVWNTTPNSDRGLRGIVAPIAARNLKELLEDPACQYVLAETMGLGLDVLSEVIFTHTGCGEDNTRLVDKVSRLAEEIWNLKERAGEVDRLPSQIEQIMKSLDTGRLDIARKEMEALKLQVQKSGSLVDELNRLLIDLDDKYYNPALWR